MCVIFRVEFIPTNRTDYFVLEVKIHAGKDDEIYTDGENKVQCVIIKIGTELAILFLSDVCEKRWVGTRSIMATRHTRDLIEKVYKGECVFFLYVPVTVSSCHSYLIFSFRRSQKNIHYDNGTYITSTTSFIYN